MSDEKRPQIVLSVDRNASGQIQVSINTENADGSGHGYRIIGPKYVGNSQNITRKHIRKYEANQIIGYLKEALDDE